MNVMTAFTPTSAYGTFGRSDRIRARRGIIGCGTGFSVALKESGTLCYAGDNRWGQKDALAWENLLAVYCGPDYVLGLSRSGAVWAAGRSDFHGIKVQSWACVNTIACGQRHAAALVENGQVLASGDNRFGQCETDTWTDMVGICCGDTFTVGLKNDGRLRCVGGNKFLQRKLERWQNIAGIFADEEGTQVLAITFGEGRILSTSPLPACTKKWRNLVFVAASSRGVYGITATGRLLSSHQADGKQMDQNTRDYLVCAAGADHMAALCRSGEVISCGHNDFGQCNSIRFGKLFQNYETFDTQRKEDEQQKERSEVLYQQRLSEATRVSRRLSCGERLTACIQADGHVSATAGLRNAKSWQNVCALSCGSAHLLALHKNGHVSADGNNVNGCCKVEDWRGVKAVIAGKYHSLGLCEDGRVLFAGWNIHEQGNVSEWKDIVLLRSTDTYTVGVARDGKMYASGKKLPFDLGALDMNEWSDLKDLALSESHMVGLRKDGRVVTVWDPLKVVDGASLAKTQTWQGVRAIAVGDGFTVGLCYGGHVLAAGRNDHGQCDTDAWRNIVAVSCGQTFTAALVSDGRVVTAGQHLSGHEATATAEEIGSAVMDWEKVEATGYQPFNTQWMTDVLALKCGRNYLVAVDRYGQVMAEGLDLDGQCTAASSFVLFRDIRQLDGFGMYTIATDLLQSNGTDIDGEGDVEKHQNQPESELISTAKKSIPNEIIPVGTTRTTEATRRVLRLYAEALSLRIFCGDTHITVTKKDGRVISCLLNKGKLLEEVALKPLTRPVLLTGRADRTLILYGDGRVRVRSNFKNASAIESLPYDLGSGNIPVKSVAEGKNHTAVLLKDGTVKLLGKQEALLPDVSLWHHIQEIAAGDHYTVGITADGRVLSAMNSGVGEGIGATKKACLTQQFSDVESVVCGARVTYGLCKNGDVLATGDDTYGQCRTEHWHHAVAIATSGEHTVALFADGHVEAIGKNDSGECNVTEWQDIIQMVAMNGITLGLTADGRVISAGKRRGVLPLPGCVHGMAVYGNKQVFVMSDGCIRMCAGDLDKTVLMPAALNLFGESSADSILSRISPVLPWETVARELLGRGAQGLVHSAFLTDRENAIWISDRGHTDHHLQRSLVWISSGLYHTLAVTADGEMLSVGAVPEDQTPVLLEAASTVNNPTSGDNERPLWISMACGVGHTAALRGDGKLFAVGCNDHGQCDTSDWEGVMIAACGAGHTVAVTHRGRALATGDRTFGQCDVDEWRELVMVACGERHTVGLCQNGRVVAAGDNRLGQCAVENAKNVISVACLPEATVCVKANGSVEIYGGTGELKERISKLRNIVAVYACEYRLSALTSDGRILRVN